MTEEALITAVASAPARSAMSIADSRVIVAYTLAPPARAIVTSALTGPWVTLVIFPGRLLRADSLNP
jgi:hypothetical protein